ncbi:hypothetical protein EON65_53685 [archaeon]|nr:MAG: hypothetical protein EON65_53685 [archaeon]
MLYSVSLILFFCCISLVLHGGVSGSAAEVSCMDFGFHPDVLRCSTCTEHVQQILGAESEVTAKCLKCCIQDIEEKYAMAVLEVDKRILKYMPDMQAVVKQKKSLGLKVRYAQISPRLLMYKNESDVEAAESVNVQSWNVDTFTDYLKAHLAVGGGSEGAGGEEKKKDQQIDKEASKKDKAKKKQGKDTEL